SASSDFDGPGVLRLQGRVNNAGIWTFIKIDQVIYRRRLPTATDIHECLCVAIDFVNRAQLGIENFADLIDFLLRQSRTRQRNDAPRKSPALRRGSITAV